MAKNVFSSRSRKCTQFLRLMTNLRYVKANEIEKEGKIEPTERGTESGQYKEKPYPY